MLKADSSYFMLYDMLDGYLDVTLGNPVEAPWLSDEKRKNDRRDAKKLARHLRVDELPESYVQPTETEKYRSLASGRKIERQAVELQKPGSVAA